MTLDTSFHIYINITRVHCSLFTLRLCVAEHEYEHECKRKSESEQFKVQLYADLHENSIHKRFSFLPLQHTSFFIFFPLSLLLASFCHASKANGLFFNLFWILFLESKFRVVGHKHASLRRKNPLQTEIYVYESHEIQWSMHMDSGAHARWLAQLVQ